MAPRRIPPSPAYHECKARIEGVIYPSEPAIEALTDQLTVEGETFMCYRCGLVKHFDEYWKDSIICDHCVFHAATQFDAFLEGKVSTLPKPQGGYRSALATLQKSSQPEFIRSVDKLVERLTRDGRSVPEMMYDKLREVEGEDLTEEQMEEHIKDNRLAVRLLELMNNAIEKRDEQLSSENPYQDIDPKQLLGVALEALLDEMTVDDELCRSVVRSMYDRIPAFVTRVQECGISLKRISEVTTA